MITIAENLKKLRRARELTQENVAQFLGVSFQAVSKWERGEGYPDITMLPIIANYFEVTIDDLLGNDLLSKEEKITAYCHKFWNENGNLTMEECVDIAKKAYSEFPYDWRIVEIYVMSLTHRFTRMPNDEEMVELRHICEFIMDKCTDATVRKRAIYTMIFAEDDEHVERWFKQAPDNADYLEDERREERYLDRKQWELYYPQKQQNMMNLVNALIEKMGYYEENRHPETRVEARQRRIEFLETMFHGTDRLLISGKYSGCYKELALALDEAGKYEEAITALEKAFSIYEEHRKFADSLGLEAGAVANFQDSMWNKLAYPAHPGKFNTRIYEAFAKKEIYANHPVFCELIAKVRAIL